ncbi:MAG TPA: M23 family metallopeptidase [Candidatus Udaeobacter sp.]|nr:M23 family metallopeptidase [Candidatus Udaeobacter sp.]
MDPRSAAAAFAASALMLVAPAISGAVSAPVSHPGSITAASSADTFSAPLSSWSPHCLGFGSQWRYCNGTPLRECANGSVWLHTGADIVATVGEDVSAAGDGVIIGFLVDPTFRGGVLIRHSTSAGVVITQYWHVWLKPGFAVGTQVTRSEVFASVADMGDKTHLHFAVFAGDYDAHAWNGALPPAACSGFPAFPYRFIDPSAFLASHAPPPPHPAPARISRGRLTYE